MLAACQHRDLLARLGKVFQFKRDRTFFFKTEYASFERIDVIA